MEFRIPLMNWHAANAPTNLPSTPKEPEEDKYLSVMDPARPSDTESVSELLVRKITGMWEGAKDPNKVVSFLSREAINPLNYLSAPGKAVAAAAGSAGILAALMRFGTVAPSRAVSAGNQAGAFRPSASRLLPSSLGRLDDSFKSTLAWRQAQNFSTDFDKVQDVLTSKVVNSKELQKYGAPEFLLDPYLRHVRDPESISEKFLPKEKTLRQFLEDRDGHSYEILMDNKTRARVLQGEYPGYGLGQIEADIADLLESKEVQGYMKDARAYMGQIKDKKPIYEFSSYVKSSTAKEDIQDGIQDIARILTEAGHGPEQLSKKTLQQLVGLAQKEEKAILEKQAKSVQALTDHTVRRTVELQTKQQLPPESKGLVQLEKETDLATETAFQNICCGAGRVDQGTMKYVPAWDPITGKREPGLGQVRTSGDNFWDRVNRGESLMFSYRPEGVPKATIELNARDGSIREIAGKNNDSMSKELKDEVLRALAPVQNRILSPEGRQRLFDEHVRNAPPGWGMVD